MTASVLFRLLVASLACGRVEAEVRKSAGPPVAKVQGQAKIMRREDLHGSIHSGSIVGSSAFQPWAGMIINGSIHPGSIAGSSSLQPWAVHGAPGDKCAKDHV